MQFNNQMCLCLNEKVTRKKNSNPFSAYIIISLFLEQTVQKERERERKGMYKQFLIYVQLTFILLHH
jgi:hypothetical protein